jgi:acetyl-CoA hydrolase/succinyl-CoA:acetate CoA-transferase
MYSERIRFQSYKDKVISAQEAANFLKDKMVVGTSGFTKAGDSKAYFQHLQKRQNSKMSPLRLSQVPL